MYGTDYRNANMKYSIHLNPNDFFNPTIKYALKEHALTEILHVKSLVNFSPGDFGPCIHM